ncbi:hypothetical protein MC885_011543 [Smutsia gigantea]|nr:hypothetical protein MC885_011543 [Smutsia gigantea]
MSLLCELRMSSGEVHFLHQNSIIIPQEHHQESSTFKAQQIPGLNQLSVKTDPNELEGVLVVVMVVVSDVRSTLFLKGIGY